jgi:hypothetical protein
VTPTLEAPAPEADPDKGQSAPVLLRRLLLVLVTTLLVARPLVLGEEPSLTDPLADPWGMVLTLLWLIAAVGWAVWRFVLRSEVREGSTPHPNPPPQGGREKEKTPSPLVGEGWGGGAPARNWYGGLAQTALLATVALVFVSAEWAAHYKFPARLIAWEWLGLFVAFFMVRQLAVTPAEQRGLYAVLLAGAVSLAAHGVYQRSVELPNTRREIGNDPEKLRQLLAHEGVYRDLDEGSLEEYLRRLNQNNIFGPYVHPNSYAGYLILWLPGLVGAVLSCWRTRVPRWQITLSIGCVVLGGTALWLTHSRGALLGLALAGGGVVLLVWRRTWRTRLIVALAGLLLLAGVVYGVGRSGLLASGVSQDTSVVAQRLEYWRLTWRMIGERPWLGVGPGNFGENYTRVMDETTEEKIKEPHNFILEMGANAGVFATLGLLVALGAFFVRTVAYERRAGSVSDRSPPVADAPGSPLRWEFYVGGMFGLLLGFVLRANALPPDEIIAETWAAGLRAVVWFAAFGLLERVPWSDREWALALTTGVAALLINLCVSDGISFPSVAGPLWIAIALALNAVDLRPVAWLSRSGAAMILPLPILVGVVLGYGTYIFYPVLGSDHLMHDAIDAVDFFHAEAGKPPAQRAALIRRDPESYLRKKVIEPLEQAVRLTPDDARLHVQLASWYGSVWELNLQKTEVSDVKTAERAIAHGMIAMRLDPDGSQGYLVQYQLRMKFGGLNESMAKSGRNRDPLFVNEKEQTAKKQYTMAAEVLGPFVEKNDPTDAKLRYALALAWFRAGENQKGREQADLARRLDEGVKLPTRRLTDQQRTQIQEWLSAASPG